MTPTREPNGQALAYRVSRLEADVDRKADADDVERVAADVAAVRRLLTGLLVTIVGFAIGALFLVAQLNASP